MLDYSSPAATMERGQELEAELKAQGNEQAATTARMLVHRIKEAYDRIEYLGKVISTETEQRRKLRLTLGDIASNLWNIGSKVEQGTNVGCD